jgi:hypothetical protein
MEMQPGEAPREGHETEPSMISGEREKPGSHSNPRLRQRLIVFVREKRVAEQRVAKMAGGGTDCFVGPPPLLSSALGRGLGSKCVDQFAEDDPEIFAISLEEKLVRAFEPIACRPHNPGQR